LTRGKESGEFITTADGQRIELGVPVKSKADSGQEFRDIPLGRIGCAAEAASSILAVVSPLFEYVTGQVIEVNGGKQM
jgi:3-oxoacyl-[acyl-carrier protein] reductase